jgi:hypothetical protein
MNRAKLILNVWVLVLVSVAMFGCAARTSNSTDVNVTLSPTAIPTLTPTKVSDLPPTPSPIPMISSAQQGLLIRRLQSTSCELPCYMGVVPGETLWPEAKGFLEGMGAIASGDVQYGGFTSHLFELKLCCEAANLIHPISLIVDGNGVVQSVSASVELGFGYKVPDYWSLYSMRRMFGQHGQPDTMVIQVDHSDSHMIAHLVMLYEADGIAAEVSLYNESGKNCFNTANVSGLKLTLTNPASGISLWRGGIAITDNLYWQKIPEAFGMVDHEFYNRVVSDPYACFQMQPPSP